MAKKLRLFKSARFFTAVNKYGNRTLAVEDVERIKDMLRYDVAFMNDQYPGVVAFVKYGTRGAGTHEGKVTLARWDSFGVKLVPLKDLPPLISAASDREAWFTYRHPRNAEGRIDSGAHERVTFASFFNEEDTGSNWA